MGLLKRLMDKGESVYRKILGEVVRAVDIVCRRLPSSCIQTYQALAEEWNTSHPKWKNYGDAIPFLIKYVDFGFELSVKGRHEVPAKMEPTIPEDFPDLPVTPGGKPEGESDLRDTKRRLASAVAVAPLPTS